MHARQMSAMHSPAERGPDETETDSRPAPAVVPQARQLKLFRRNMHFLHKTAQHEIH